MVKEFCLNIDSEFRGTGTSGLGSFSKCDFIGLSSTLNQPNDPVFRPVLFGFYASYMLIRANCAVVPMYYSGTNDSYKSLGRRLTFADMLDYRLNLG